MKHIFDIAEKDILQILRDRLSFMFLLIMPIAFTILFSIAFGGSGGGQADSRLPVGYLDLDGSPLSQNLQDFLQASPAIRLEEQAGATSLDLETKVAQGELDAAVIVPVGFAEAAQRANPLNLSVLANPDSSRGQSAQSAVQTAANRLASAVKTARIALSLGLSFDDTLAAALAAWQEPPVSLTAYRAVPAGTQTQSQGTMNASQTAPGMMLQFGIAGLMTAAQVLVSERKSRCLQRILTTPVARHEILMGHYLALFTVTFVQFLLLIVFGQIVMGLNYLRQPLATLLMAAASALFIGGMGLLIGVLAKTDDQAIIFAIIPMFIFAGLGGAWVPLENTGATFQAIGHLSPVAWAMDGFKNILVRGLDLSSIWLPAAALLGYAALFCGLAVWKFRYE